LVNYFLRKFSAKTPKSISAEALSLLEQYQWPGNVRELENIIRRALVVAKGEAILASDLPSELMRRPEALLGAPAPGGPGSSFVVPAPVPPKLPSQGGSASSSPGASSTDLSAVARALFKWARENSKLKIIPAVERELVIQALVETEGNQVQAAKLLGITRATLRKRIEKFNIKQQLAIE